MIETLPTNAELMLPDNYTSREQPSECLRTDETQYWNVAAYERAAKWIGSEVVRDMFIGIGGPTSVCDLGCGDGKKVCEYFSDYEVYGCDQATQPHVLGELWEPCDLNMSTPPRADMYLLIDVIEHLSHPLDLLRAIKSRNRPLYLSTPERDLTHGINTLGPPPNTSHVREWTVSELYRLVQSVGFVVKSVELLPARIGHTKPTAIGMLLL